MIKFLSIDIERNEMIKNYVFDRFQWIRTSLEKIKFIGRGREGIMNAGCLLVVFTRSHSWHQKFTKSLSFTESVLISGGWEAEKSVSLGCGIKQQSVFIVTKCIRHMAALSRVTRLISPRGLELISLAAVWELLLSNYHKVQSWIIVLTNYCSLSSVSSSLEKCLGSKKIYVVRRRSSWVGPWSWPRMISLVFTQDDLLLCLIVTSSSHPARVGILAAWLDILSWFFSSLSRLHFSEGRSPTGLGAGAWWASQNC